LRAGWPPRRRHCRAGSVAPTGAQRRSVWLAAMALNKDAKAPAPIAKELFLHIGMQKTGSTSIQDACRVNRAPLAAAGLLYPRTPGDKNHIKLTLFAWDGGKTNRLPLAAGVGDPEKYRRFKSEFVDNLGAEIGREKCSSVILSNEHLSSRLKDPVQLERLAVALRSIARKITVVVYLRPQHELAISSYSTKVKGGSVRPMRFPRHDQAFYFNYEWMLSLWADAFGERNLVVRIFDRSELIGDDIVKDFFDTIGHAIPTGFVFSDARNPSLDTKTLEFLRAFNEHLPAFQAGEANPERGDIIPAMEAIAKGGTIWLPKEQLRAFADLFKVSNANVARQYLGRSDGVLFKTLNFDRGGEPERLTVDDAIRIAAHLWQWKQRQLLDARKRLARATDKMPDEMGLLRLGADHLDLV